MIVVTAHPAGRPLPVGLALHSYLAEVRLGGSTEEGQAGRPLPGPGQPGQVKEGRAFHLRLLGFLGEFPSHCVPYG